MSLWGITLRMCMFSRPVLAVSKKRIFARHQVREGVTRQVLIYAMSVTADEELAMVLPIPTPAGSGEDAVRFVNLEACPGLFSSLDALFPPLYEASRMVSGGFPPQQSANRLEVHDVGAFEASFVPSRADFVRLDPRFVLADSVWSALPYEDDWGYAVFKLKAGHIEPGATTGLWGRLKSWFGGSAPPSVTRPRARDFHPMAFVFPTRMPSRLFFPTMHVHDGDAVPRRADFDHQLYAQGDWAPPDDWRCDKNTFPVSNLVGLKHTQGLLDGELPAYRYTLQEIGDNRDVVLTRAGCAGK